MPPRTARPRSRSRRRVRPSRVRPRRTQAERSARTRERLLEATLACLVERGWAGTTTTLVAERAGVSRGAELHHFPTRGELLAAALSHLAERRIEEYRRAIAALPAGVDPIAKGVELLWATFSDPTAYALLELVVAARTDRELRASLAPVAHALDARLDAFEREILPAGLSRSPRLRTLRQAAFLLVQGLALHSIVHDDARERAAILRFLTEISRDALRAPAKEKA
jgi:AcrR family transcriptional regulator